MCKVFGRKDPQCRWIFKNDKVTDRVPDDRISIVLAHKAKHSNQILHRIVRFQEIPLALELWCVTLMDCYNKERKYNFFLLPSQVHPCMHNPRYEDYLASGQTHPPLDLFDYSALLD